MLIAQITCSRASFSIRAEVNLKQGVFYGLIGPSGSGKTTFLHALAGLVPANGEIKFKEEVQPRYNYQIKNPSETVNLVNTFESGSIAMVKSGKNKSSSTEFFFVTTKIPELDGRYSIFGKIIKGLDVLEKINKEDYIKTVQISN